MHEESHDLKFAKLLSYDLKASKTSGKVGIVVEDIKDAANLPQQTIRFEDGTKHNFPLADLRLPSAFERAGFITRMGVTLLKRLRAQ